MKTATIIIHHVFGTKGTSYAEVQYRGKRRWAHMANISINDMLSQAKDWAKNEGFTHFKIV